jgi:1,4-alpha-glucan branching enzyme
MERNVVKTTANKATKTKARPAKKAGALETAPARQTVTLAVKGLTARRVAVAGSFNNWSPDAAPMSCQEDGTWQAKLSLAPGSYEYLIVADGSWLPDPGCADAVANPYGGFNSVLRVN